MFTKNIETLTLKNTNFRRVISTTKKCQLVLMSLAKNEEIGMETHKISDQFFRIEKGKGLLIINGEKHIISDGSAFVIPAGTKHNVINTSKTNPLKLYTIYSPPHHAPNKIDKFHP